MLTTNEATDTRTEENADACVAREPSDGLLEELDESLLATQHYMGGLCFGHQRQPLTWDGLW